MSVGLQPYSAYKPSGVEWLGEVPAHWDVVKVKWLWKEVDDRSEDGTEQLLSVSQYVGVTLATNEPRSESLKGYRRCQPNDLVMNIMLAWLGGLGVSNYEGVVSPAYSVFRLTSGNDAHYLGYLYRTKRFLSEFVRNSAGIVPSRWRLYPQKFGNIQTLLPPKPEQTAIARFLSQANDRVDRYIHAKEKLIALVDEYKQILIHHAVTGRIDVRTGEPYPEYKASGVEWLGEVPAHWETSRAYHRLAPRKQPIVPDDISEQQEVFHYSIPNVQRYGGGAVEAGSSIDSAKILVDRTLLLVSKLNPRKNTIALAVPDQRLTTLASGEFVALEPRDCSALFARYLYESESVRRELSSRVASATKSHQRCSPEDITKLAVPFPPLSEQTAIARYLESAIADITNTIDRANREICLLREYCTRLIADVVTGKFDVREATAELLEASPIPDHDGPDTIQTDSISRLPSPETTLRKEGDP